MRRAVLSVTIKVVVDDINFQRLGSSAAVERDLDQATRVLETSVTMQAFRLQPRKPWSFPMILSCATAWPKNCVSLGPKLKPALAIWASITLAAAVWADWFALRD